MIGSVEINMKSPTFAQPAMFTAILACHVRWVRAAILAITKRLHIAYPSLPHQTHATII